MIQAGQRSTLVEAMMPPAGYVFDAGVATTYSLDLETLLVLPVHLAWLAASDDVEAQRDQIRLLEGLRRSMGRLTVFLDRGCMHVPKNANALIGLTEGMIHEVSAPHGGAFHPKLWVLRFVPEEGEAPAFVRMLVLSRNLTDDRSWDINLCLEGIVSGGAKAVNREVAALLRVLPDWAHKPVPPERKATIESLADSVRRCDWELPDGFSELALHVLGAGPKPRAFTIPDSHEVVVVSPFVSDEALRRLADGSRSALALISRPDQIALLDDDTRELFDRVLVLDDDADLGGEEEAASNALRGLHAKVIVQRHGAWTRLLVGSANCTNAALVRGVNVELVAELVGHREKVGVPEHWLSSERGLGAVLRPSPEMDAADLRAERALEDALDACKRGIVKAGLRVDCVPVAEGNYVLRLLGREALGEVEAAGAQVFAWPLSVRPERQRNIAAGVEGQLGVFAPHEVTSLIGFRVRIGAMETSFGLDLPMDNPPPDRDESVLSLLISNREAFLRYLSMLLGEIEGGMKAIESSYGLFGGFAAAHGDQGSPALFELLLRTYSREPGRLEHVAEVIEQLRAVEHEPGQPIVSPEFLEIWKVFEQARGLENDA